MAVNQPVPNLDDRLSELQAQVDGLAVSLHLWQERQEHARPPEERLAELTRQCADLLHQLNRTGERQARAVGELEERVHAFGEAEDRLHQEASNRLRALERGIEQEWTELRRLNEAPARELREQADTLSRMSVATATSSVVGFDRAEARLAAIEQALQQRLNAVSEQLAAAVSEIRSLTTTRALEAPPPQAWPIEGVVRLHNQLRDAADPSSGAAPPAAPPPSASTIEVFPMSGQASTAPRDAAGAVSVEPGIAGRRDEPASSGDREPRLVVPPRTMVAGAVLLVLLIGAGGWMAQRQSREAAARAAAAERQAQAAITAAGAQMAAIRDESAKQMAAARESAARAQTVSNVLASPDLVRFNIAGSGPAAISGQVLWSRSRGVVFSGVRLPPPPARMTYQLWLLTDSAPVTAGTFEPDANGGVTFTADAPIVPRPVSGAALTLEPSGGSQTPSDRLFVRNRLAAPAVPAAPVPPAPTAAP